MTDVLAHVSSIDEPRNNLVWRINRLERDVEELKQGQPAVLAERVKHLSDDVMDLRQEVKSMKRMFVSTFSAAGVAITAAVVALIISGGSP